MSDNKKYYYLKLKDNFFDSEEMKLLESQINGEKYQNFYLKLCLLSLKSEGKLVFKEYIPYDDTMLSTVLRVDIDTVKIGIDIFKTLGLIDIMESGMIYMTDIQALIGRSSSEAERIKAYRTRLQVERQGVTNVQNCTPEIEKEIEIELNTEKKPDKQPTVKKPKEHFSPPSKEQIKEYCLSKNIKIDEDHFINYYQQQGWKLSNGNPMKDWKAAVNLWYKREVNWQNEKKPAAAADKAFGWGG